MRRPTGIHNETEYYSINCVQGKRNKNVWFMNSVLLPEIDDWSWRNLCHWLISVNWLFPLVIPSLRCVIFHCQSKKSVSQRFLSIWFSTEIRILFQFRALHNIQWNWNTSTAQKWHAFIRIPMEMKQQHIVDIGPD